MEKRIAKTAQLGDKPFYILNHTNFESELPYTYYLPFFYTYPMKAETEVPKVHCYETSDMNQLAAALKKDFDARPDGARYFQLTLIPDAFKAKVESVVYFDKGVEMVKTWLTAFLTEYKRIGGKLDGIIADLEYIWSHNYYLQDFYHGTGGKPKNENIYNDIVKDPRYATEIRPLLEKYGFKFYETPSGVKSEIWCIYPEAGLDEQEFSTAIWNTLMDNRECEAINRAVYEPLIQFYPDAIVSDYHSGAFHSWTKPLDNFGKIKSLNLINAGNASNFNTYACRPELSFYGSANDPVYKNPPGYNHAVYEASAFKNLLYEINIFKNMYSSTDNGIMNAWVADYLYNIESDALGVSLDGTKTTYSNTPYYSEAIFHIGLLNPQPFLGFVVSSRVNARGGDKETCLGVLSDLMVELTRVAGASDRKPIQTQASWNGSYILSGMYAAGRNIWRLTPDTNVVSLEKFRVSGAAVPTFSIEGLTITFPQGKILADGNVRQVGTCGYWIETPANVMPVITGTADRYRQNPSFEENFDSYTAGSVFTAATALPQACWQVQGSAVIQARYGGNSLALSGNTIVKNVNLPQNITAGDEYAKQQAWEVTFTPSGKGEFMLLACGSHDDGIKISEGRVYVGNSQELDDLKLSVGSTYTVRREVNFRTPDCFTCDYAIYDGAGKLLKDVKKVQMQTFPLPVSSVTVAENKTNSSLLIDNYKMYPTGVTTVLELYETTFGKKITDTDVIRTEETAYRLSWMNAENCSCYAEIYNSKTDESIRTVKMPLGMDGVVTGVVKASSEKPLTLAVRIVDAENPDISTDSSHNDAMGM